jgi:hypothetical protein
MEIDTINTDTIADKFSRAEELGLCPECGAVMSEMERLPADSYTFIWYKCSRSDCDGQWLQKKLTATLLGKAG